MASKTRRRIRAGPEVPGAGGREEEPCEPTPPPRARALARWGWGWSRNSEAGARTGPGPGRGGLRGGGSSGGGRPWRRVCLSRGRSLGAGDREAGRAGEEGCGSVEAAATGTRRHHLRCRRRRSRRLSGRGAAAGTARRRPARQGRCPSPSEVPAAPRSPAPPTPHPSHSPALERGGFLLTHCAPIPFGPGPLLRRRAFPFSGLPSAPAPPSALRARPPPR